MTAPIATNSSVPNSKALGARPKTDHAHEGHRDTAREIFETVVFVVVLVLLLKLFVAEAFVIPTGSMAPTLWGDQVRCTCRKCGHKFPINVSVEGGKHVPITIPAYICENCGYSCTDGMKDLSSISSGDRVLVSKYEYHLRDPRRFEIPVFRFPVEPFLVQLQGDVLDLQGMNYIKRLVGIGGETLAVFAGDLYTTTDLDYKHIPPDERPQNDMEGLAVSLHVHEGRGGQKVLPRPGNSKSSTRRPTRSWRCGALSSTSITNRKDPPAFAKPAGKLRRPTATAGKYGRRDSSILGGDAPGSMIYQHINPWDDSTLAPQFISDAIGYNFLRHNFANPFPGRQHDPSWIANHWVSDLILDCTAEITSPDAEVVLELSKGRNRLQATFTKGECRLARINTPANGQEVRTEMGSHPTKMTKAEKYALRLANVDSRMTVWVDGKALRFNEDQTDYAPPDPTSAFEPFQANDLQQPARIGATGEVTCSKVSLWRDLHYNCGFPGRGDNHRQFDPADNDLPDCGDYLQTYYVQPGHYLMMGDNTNSSSDSRAWGVVPERLMLGRAVVIYFPFSRMGVIE